MAARSPTTIYGLLTRKHLSELIVVIRQNYAQHAARWPIKEARLLPARDTCAPLFQQGNCFKECVCSYVGQAYKFGKYIPVPFGVSLHQNGTDTNWPNLWAQPKYSYKSL